MFFSQCIKRTQDRIKVCFYWPGRDADVRRYCKSCGICRRTVHKARGGPPAPLGKMPLIDTPFKQILIDLIGPMKPKSSEGHQYILTVMDYPTRYPEAIALKESSAKEIAQALMTVFSGVGIPEEIITAQGRQFTANYMQELMDTMNIKHFIKLCIEQPHEWRKLIDPLLFAYRELPNEATGFSPFELVYG